MVFMVFSKEDDLEKIVSIFCNMINISNDGRGNDIHLSSEHTELDVFVYTTTMGDEVKEYVEKQKSGAVGHFAGVKSAEEDIKINLLHHLKRMQSFIVFDMKSDAPENEESSLNQTISLILDFAKNVDGLVVADNAGVVIGPEGHKIFDVNGESNVPFYFPFKYVESPEVFSECSRSQVDRRNRNMKELFGRHIYVCELPLNDGEETAKIRSKDEVVERAMGLLLVSLFSESILNPEYEYSPAQAREYIAEVMAEFGIKNFEDVMTDEELKYIKDDNSDEKTQIKYSWCYENLYIMEWCLGLEEWNFPDRICDVPKLVRNIRQFDSMDDIKKRCSMRSMTEILDKADYIYRVDWAAVDARIMGLNGPAGIDHGVSMEWHRALNWMICFDDAKWDNVDTPT